MKNGHKHIGNPRGRISDKNNRTQRIINIWPEIKAKMEHIIIRGHGSTLSARCAYSILLIMETGIRVGNERSAEGYICNQKHHPDYGKQIQVYGLTTLTTDHVHVTRNQLTLNFVGKKAVHQSLSTSNPILLEYSKAVTSHNLPTFLGITYMDCYRFVRRYIGKKFSPKDIRTAFVNIIFCKYLSHIPSTPITTKKALNKTIADLVLKTAEHVGHTKGVCKKSYLSNNMIEFVKGRLRT